MWFVTMKLKKYNDKKKYVESRTHVVQREKNLEFDLRKCTDV